jgi:tRNA threonylcarbamoyladenosine biosynthesis protein TsaE
VYTATQVEQVANQLADILKTVAVMTFTGPLGAGKTTLIKALLQASGVRDEVTSPTFTYMNQYEGIDGFMFYHFDLYRIESVESFIEMGFHEYLYQPHSVALIEWPAVIDSLLVHSVCHVTIDYCDDLGVRVLKVMVKE